MRRWGFLAALVLVGGLMASSTISVGAAGAWRTFGVARVDGHGNWKPQATVFGQTMRDPTEVRVAVLMAESFGDDPFDTKHQGGPGTFWVEWELWCNARTAPSPSILIVESGKWQKAGKVRITKRFTTVRGQPLTDYDFCALKVSARMGGTGRLAVNTQAQY